MGMRIPAAELKRWERAGLIAPAGPPNRPPGGPQLRDDDDCQPPCWRVLLTLPGLKLVSRSNAREHWATRHKRDKREAQALRAAWHAAGLAGWRVPLPAIVTLTRIGGKRMDGDNLQSAYKAIRDAAAKLIGIDDADERVRWRYRQKPGQLPMVLIAIRPAK